MKELRYLAMIFAFIGLVFFTGCGDDDETTGPDTGNYTATVLSFGFNTPLEALVTLLDNADGDETTTTATSDAATGAVTLEVPLDEDVAFMCTQAGHWDTYQFNLDPTATDETLWIVNDAVVDLNLLTSGAVLQAGTGVVAGAVYYDDQGTEVPVGCATIESDPAGEVYYFNLNPDFTFNAVPNDTLNFTHPAIGYFLAANIPVGAGATAVTMTASIEGAEVGTVEFFAYPDAISISNIYSDTPTPDGCGQ